MHISDIVNPPINLSFEWKEFLDLVLMPGFKAMQYGATWHRGHLDPEDLYAVDYLKKPDKDFQEIEFPYPKPKLGFNFTVRKDRKRIAGHEVYFGGFDSPANIVTYKGNVVSEGDTVNYTLYLSENKNAPIFIVHKRVRRGLDFEHMIACYLLHLGYSVVEIGLPFSRGRIPLSMRYLNNDELIASEAKQMVTDLRDYYGQSYQELRRLLDLLDSQPFGEKTGLANNERILVSLSRNTLGGIYAASLDKRITGLVLLGGGAEFPDVIWGSTHKYVMKMKRVLAERYNLEGLQEEFRDMSIAAHARNIQGNVLFINGEDDGVFPKDTVELLIESLPKGTTVLTLKVKGHIEPLFHIHKYMPMVAALGEKYM